MRLPVTFHIVAFFFAQAAAGVHVRQGPRASPRPRIRALQRGGAFASPAASSLALPNSLGETRMSLRGLSSVESQDHSSVATVASAVGSGFGRVFGTDDQLLARQFLSDRKGDTTEAVEKLRKAVDWREQFGPVPIPSELYKEEEHQSNKCFLHETNDIQGRPVVVVKVKNHRIGEYPIESSQRLCVATIEKAVERMSDPHGEICLLFDLDGFSLRNADFSFAKFLVQVLYKYYPRRLGVAYFIDAPLVFQGPWRVVKPWLRSYAELVKFVRWEEVPQIFSDPSVTPKLRR